MAKLLTGDAEPSITAFIVEKDHAGFQIGQKFDMLGMRGYSTCELVFNDCQVPRQNLLGEHGWGRKVALSSLAKGRVTIAAQATGWAQGALDGLVRVVKDGFVRKDDALTSAIGTMSCQVESARVLTFQAARAIDAGSRDATLASMAKACATDLSMKIATEALSLAGTAGMRPEY